MLISLIAATYWEISAANLSKMRETFKVVTQLFDTVTSEPFYLLSVRLYGSLTDDFIHTPTSG